MIQKDLLIFLLSLHNKFNILQIQVGLLLIVLHNDGLGSLAVRLLFDRHVDSLGLRIFSVIAARLENLNINSLRFVPKVNFLSILDGISFMGDSEMLDLGETVISFRAEESLGLFALRDFSGVLKAFVLSTILLFDLEETVLSFKVDEV